MSKKNVVLLGATGAIGKMCLDVLLESGDYKVCVATAYKNKEDLDRIRQEYNIDYTYLIDAKNEKSVHKLADSIRNEFSPKNTIIINAIQGSGGLNFSKAFINYGFDIYLANKETIVCGGKEFLKKAEEKNSKIIPLDTEMVALLHLIKAFGKECIDEYIITASGGPFKDYTDKQLKNVNYNDAVKHPVWKMGEEISVDSATLLNKALEIVEAVNLFDIKPNQIKVLIHKESFVHSLVRLKNGMLYAELYTPCQKVAIRDALALNKKTKPFEMIPTLTFEEADIKKYSALELGFTAASSNEIANRLVEAKELAFQKFKKGELDFIDIVPFVKKTLALCGKA